jgi:phosphohistidine phosphatase
MELLIIRHAIAVDRTTPGLPDDQRALTPEGRKKFREAARGLTRIVKRPDALLTSPLLRARQTAEIAAVAWGRRPKPRELQALADGDFAGLAAALGELPPTALVAVVGHEPHVSDLLGRLLGGSAPERLTFRKGGAALVELPGSLKDGGRLVWYLRPRVLRRLAG